MYKIVHFTVYMILCSPLWSLPLWVNELPTWAVILYALLFLPICLFCHHLTDKVVKR